MPQPLSATATRPRSAAPEPCVAIVTAISRGRSPLRRVARSELSTNSASA
jgi:hypothetical protein